jgi:hypothetical protein
VKKFLGALITLTLLISIIGCGTAPRPTPAPTLAPVVITVVITATPPAGTDTPAPTLAPTGTLTTTGALTLTQTLVAAAKPTNTTTRGNATATRRTNTATPTRAGTAVPTGIPYQAKYASPVNLLRPIYSGNDPGDQRDTRTAPGDALVFEWQSNGGLGSGECYLVRVSIKSLADNSERGDAFLQCDTAQTLQGPAQTVRFTLNKPGYSPGPTYGGLIPSGGGDMHVVWNVQIAKDEGLASSGGFYMATDASRHNVTLLSPVSKTVYFILRGGP